MDRVTPQKPVRADHRFLMKFVKTVLGDKVECRPSEFSRLARVFYSMGGSWERIFKGSPSDVSLLKKIIKGAHKSGFLTKREKWGSSC